MLLIKLSAIGLLVFPAMGSHDHLHIQSPNHTQISVERHYLESPLLDEPLMNEKHYEDFVSHVQNIVYTPPHNAYINEHNQIVPEVAGYMLHERKFRNLVDGFLFSKGSGLIEPPLLTLYPKVDSEILAHIRTQKIGQYVTFFNNHNEERTQNITLATKKINNAVVFPGEVFSFNGVVGKRTKEKGYKKAPVIVRGELSEDIGGGICQVSSTLYNAVDQAGVTILERYHHSKRVPYVPKGRDATVSWYGPDFTFKNAYNQPILIRAKIIGGQVIITVHSSDLINVQKRKVPSASHKLPQEKQVDHSIQN
ncbi:VanW family protein [Rossellomorea sp. SC111]|uniref:VanW family protein n=1 Tax=Rossellomorea sp. SC111 TaxID=2968985 RepID=UPI00215A7C6E|nr:VanW family protein [Rossellomorea sp. SC111]MCR8848766.1 VanW family protein [Rossellomorea sp. SC111]